jgi:hypothetical protein
MILVHFLNGERGYVEETALGKMQNQTNISMAPAILVEVDDETNLLSESISEKSEDQRCRNGHQFLGKWHRLRSGSRT